MITPLQKLHQKDRSSRLNLQSTGNPKLARLVTDSRRAGSQTASHPSAGYFTSTAAPASVNFFRMVSASSLETPSFTAFGAPSTRSLASFRPRLVTSRTALITLILLAPTSFKMTLNSVFSSAGAAAAAPPPPAIITGAAAAAETPSLSSSFLTNCAASSSDNPTICSSNCCRSAMSVFSVSNYQFADSLPVGKVSSALRLLTCRARQRRSQNPAQPSPTDNQIFPDSFRRLEIRLPMLRDFTPQRLKLL